MCQIIKYHTYSEDPVVLNLHTQDKIVSRSGTSADDDRPYRVRNALCVVVTHSPLLIKASITNARCSPDHGMMANGSVIKVKIVFSSYTIF